MVDLANMPARDMTDDQLRAAIVAARERLTCRAQSLWLITGRPAYPQPDDLVQAAIVALLELSELPGCAVGAWLHKKVLNFAGNAARNRSTARNFVEAERHVPGEPGAIEPRERNSAAEQVLGWLRLQAALEDDPELGRETAAVLGAWEAEYYGEGDIADLTGLSIPRVRAAIKRIARRLKALPPRITAAVDAELARTP